VRQATTTQASWTRTPFLVGSEQSRYCHTTQQTPNDTSTEVRMVKAIDKHEIQNLKYKTVSKFKHGFSFEQH
jgi:hypothetical protein